MNYYYFINLHKNRIGRVTEIPMYLVGKAVQNFWKAT